MSTPLQAQHTNGATANTTKPVPMTEAEQIDAIRRYRYVNMDVEAELTRLEGLRDALRIVRGSDDCTAAPMKPRGQNAMLGLITEVLDQISRVRRAFDGEPEPGAGEDGKPLWAKNSTRTGQLMELIGDVTDEDLDKANSDDLNCISELCLAMDRRIDETTGARHRAKRAMAKAD